MSQRLARGLAEYIEQCLPGRAKFVLIDNIPENLALDLSRVWSNKTGLPTLAVASAHPERFGNYALVGASGTGLRNQHPEGICLVICEGSQIPDRQSVRSFENVAPSHLLRGAEELLILARIDPPVPEVGSSDAVRRALLLLSAGERPPAAAVADYFDSLAAGRDALESLPILGAFTDRSAGGAADLDRVLENFRLAGRRRRESALEPEALSETQHQAERVLRGRGRPPAEAAERFVELLRSGSDELLREFTFIEAREILEQPVVDLGEEVQREIEQYRLSLEDAGAPEAATVDWDIHQRTALSLKSVETRKDAARDLLAFDEAENYRVFRRSTRRKLISIAKDREIQAVGSCPEAALVRALVALAAPPKRIALVSPNLTPAPAPGHDLSRSAARAMLSIACGRVRLQPLFRLLQEQYAVEVDGNLLQDAGELLTDAAFAELGTAPPDTLRIRIYPIGDEASVLVQWRPDADDLVLLRTVSLLGASPALSLAGVGDARIDRLFELSPPAIRAPSGACMNLAARLQRCSASIVKYGVSPELLRDWVGAWIAEVEARRTARSDKSLDELALSGTIIGADGSVTLTPLAPLKAEWFADYLATLREIVVGVLDAQRDDADTVEPVEATAGAIASATAAHYPAFLRVPNKARPLLPTAESRLWSTFGGSIGEAPDSYASATLGAVLQRMLDVQPEAGRHFRALAWGPGAADLLLQQALALTGSASGGGPIGRFEIFCVGRRPTGRALSEIDAQLRDESEDRVQLRYLADLQSAAALLGNRSGSPGVHLALVTGLTESGQKLLLNTVETELPEHDEEVLFAPRTWIRPAATRRTLLVPPGVSDAGAAWLQLMTAIDDDWGANPDAIAVPELRTDSADLVDELKLAHDLASWVATLDRYATRDSLELALGDEVAILHQERRLSPDSPLALVISQKSGGPTDRAVGRSLRTARIVENQEVALRIGTDLRKVASQGYGILALEAATTGSGINELVGHVVAFSLLETRATPWPLPPNCRVLLLSLDEYPHWFPSGRRADLLAMALDIQEGGVHAAAFEVKARRSDVQTATVQAVDQLRQTLAATRYAAYPEPGSPHSRLWLNRIADAAYAMARESGFRFEREEIEALEEFRRGRGTLEWAGVGLIFGPQLEPFDRYLHQIVAGDRVPIAIHGIRLTEDLLVKATGTRLNNLRTVEAAQPPLGGGRQRRRPETGVPRRPREQPSEQSQEPDGNIAGVPREGPNVPQDGGTGGSGKSAVGRAEPVVETPQISPPPMLGWDLSSGEELHWTVSGEGALPNGHVEIWGSSGAGKTQFIKGLLAQLAVRGGARFGIADFKNDYGDDFCTLVGAKFLDLWGVGAPYNPLALTSSSPRAIEGAVIEIRDMVDIAARAFVRMGPRQLSKLERALHAAYDDADPGKGSWPTLQALDEYIDEDLAPIVGNLTRYRIFKDGPPLGDIVNSNIVFGLHAIPGSGLTTVLAAGFILSSLLAKMQELPPVANLVKYAIVIDEAHRVAALKAVDTMVREGRSKGIAVILATQQPGDLPEVVATNAQTKICFRLPDATVATTAARRLDPMDASLPEVVRTLGVGEALVSLGGARPRLLKMVQFFRDSQLLLPNHRGATTA